MKIVKKILASILVVAVVLSFTACHGKGEIAATVTSGDKSKEFTSAMYMYALMSADMEARNTVDAEATSAVEDYQTKQIEGKKFSVWVKERAIENLKTYSYYTFKAQDLGVTLSDQEKEEAAQFADMYWNYYGYSSTFEPNGVGFNTYKAAQENLALSTAIFNKIYGVGGEKAVDEATVAKSLAENFEIVNIIEVDTSEYKDAEVTALKNKFEGYRTRLLGGETFEKIYCEYYETSPEDHSEHNHDGESSSTDHYAVVVGSEDTSYAHDAFKDIKKMKVGDVSVYTEVDDSVMLIVRRDVTADKYYSENLKEPTLWLLKETEYNETIDKEIAEYKIDLNKFATDRFKVKNIEYPSYQ